MSYQVLARKYRSKNFEELIGQDHVSVTLLNAIKADRLPHALLFTGLRGTGKTSTARILAKILRCEDLQNYKPCNVCNSCMEINSGSSVDVLEIDGASNNGVDSIRDLRETVMFSPSRGKYKILIIDEVHMLSASAFNALLKTLEEPPAHVIFMMATTEVQKIPLTILSRCQRFDLRRISLTELTRHLKKICEYESIAADEKALWLIARQGDGSARDSLSLLDQVINFSSGQVTEVNVNLILGLTERSLIFSIFKNLLVRDESALIGDFKRISVSATNPSQLLEDFLRLIRHGLLIKSVSADKISELVTIELPSEEIEQLTESVRTVSESDLHLLFDMGLKTLQDVSRGFDPLLVLEIGLLRMCHAPQMASLKEFFSGNSLQRPVQAVPLKPTSVISAPQVMAMTPSRASVPVVKKPETKPETKPVSAPVPKNFPVLNNESWMMFIAFLKTQNSYLSAQCEQLSLARVVDKKITFQLPVSFAFLAQQIGQLETKKKVQAFIDSYFGEGYTFEVQNAKAVEGDSAVSLNQKKEVAAEAQLTESWMKDPRVQKAQEIFKGQIKIVTKE